MRRKYDLRELAKALKLRTESAQSQATAVAAEIASHKLDPAAADFDQGSSPRCLHRCPPGLAPAPWIWLPQAPSCPHGLERVRPARKWQPGPISDEHARWLCPALPRSGWQGAARHSGSVSQQCMRTAASWVPPTERLKHVLRVDMARSVQASRR